MMCRCGHTMTRTAYARAHCSHQAKPTASMSVVGDGLQMRSIHCSVIHFVLHQVVKRSILLLQRIGGGAELLHQRVRRSHPRQLERVLPCLQTLQCWGTRIQGGARCELHVFVLPAPPHPTPHPTIQSTPPTNPTCECNQNTGRTQRMVTHTTHERNQNTGRTQRMVTHEVNDGRQNSRTYHIAMPCMPLHSSSLI
jgi:hypothetical protein